MGQGLDVLQTCDGTSQRRQRDRSGSGQACNSNWGDDRPNDDHELSCGMLEDGFRNAVASANRGGGKISDEVLLNHELLQHARQGNAKGVSDALEKGAWTETRRPLVMKPQKPDRTKGNPKDAKEAAQNGMTALMFASQYGSAECVRRLVLAGAEVNAIEEDGWSSLHFAAHEAHLEVCKLLLKGKADPTMQNAEDLTPIDVALREDPAFGKHLKQIIQSNFSH
eukprot:TRINITY_DN46741_c0_g1_i1.p1 TRINITY_DN46741_c0_g1~~TRINITY_DN46741_c0_g1_i1.p1  ORF type:complete len:224 (+),score=46.08 TRINITY_DN46741_c0_g1_i1:73-744(+)